LENRLWAKKEAFLVLPAGNTILDENQSLMRSDRESRERDSREKNLAAIRFDPHLNSGHPSYSFSIWASGIDHDGGGDVAPGSADASGEMGSGLYSCFL